MGREGLLDYSRSCAAMSPPSTAKRKASKRVSKAAKSRSGDRRKPKQERSRALVDAILTATAQLLRTEGPKATTTNKIAKRAGVSVGSLYQYFPNKTELYTALAARHVATTQVEVAALLDRFRDNPELDIVEFIVESIVTIHRVDAPLLVELQRLSLWGQTSEVMTDALRRSEALIAEHLQQRAADLPRELAHPELSARLLVSAMSGVLTRAIEDRAEGIDDPAFIAELTRLVGAYLGYEVKL